MIRATARSSRIASWPRCRPSRPPPTSTRWASRSSTRATTWTTAATCCTCSSRCPASPTRSIRSPPRRSICCSSCMPITSRMPAPRPCAWPAAPAPIPYAAISAGVAALWGPAHGGANEAVLAMLEQIGTVENIPKYLAMAKDKTSHFRLMGFGHRVYKNFDPRAKIIREMCHQVLAKLGRTDNPLFELALRLEEIALQGRVLRFAQALPERGFLFGHHLQRARHSALDVHGDVRDRAHRGLGGALAGDDRRSEHAHQPAAPALHRAGAARLRAASSAAPAAGISLRPAPARPRRHAAWAGHRPG